MDPRPTTIRVLIAVTVGTFDVQGPKGYNMPHGLGFGEASPHLQQDVFGACLALPASNSNSTGSKPLIHVCGTNKFNKIPFAEHVEQLKCWSRIPELAWQFLIFSPFHITTMFKKIASA